MAAYDEDQGILTEDRWTNRSKYNRQKQSQIIAQHDAEQQIQSLEKQNSELVQGVKQTMYETQEVASDTLVKLDSQRNQLINTDRNLYEIKENLKETEGILDGMKGWRGFIKNKLKIKNQNSPSHGGSQYQCSVPKKSIFNRNKKQRFLNEINEKNQTTMNKSDTPLDHDLEEILHGIKAINQMANDTVNELTEQNVLIDDITQKIDETMPTIKRQNHTMKEICR
eukprot:47519_1